MASTFLTEVRKGLEDNDGDGGPVEDYELTPAEQEVCVAAEPLHLPEHRLGFQHGALGRADDAVVVHDAGHPVHELREHSLWSEGQVWCSPERHGQITGIMKTQIDHLPLAYKGLRPTQGRTLAVMQVSAGSQSFNSVNTLRILGRWMRMFTIPNQSSVAKAYEEFDAAGRMKPSSYYDRIVDVCEELVRFTVLLRPHGEQLVDRYSERVDAGRPVSSADGSL